MYFANVTSLDELKKEYRRLVMLHHPDRGGDNATMQSINNEYERKHEELRREWNDSHDDAHQCTETPEEFRAIIAALLKLDGVEVELCGSWLWLSGNTYEHRDELKKLGCRWASSKKMWSWHHAEDGSRYYRGKKTIGEIRNKYGSQTFVNGSEFARLGATA